MGWDLQTIRTKVRKVTGRFSPQEMLDSTVDTYINNFYRFTLPAELKMEKLHQYYEFLTTQNQAWYDLPETLYTNLEPPAYIDYQLIDWYQSPGQFLAATPYNITRGYPWTGDGVEDTFSTTVTGFPIMPASLVITDNVEVFQDTSQTWTDSNVTITGTEDGTCTVNYSTGEIEVEFMDPPEDGVEIALSYQLFQPGTPQCVLMYNNQLQFYPPPDTAYRFRCQSYATLPSLTENDDTPELEEWGPAIAYGAARDIFADFGENDAYAETTELYKEQLAYIITRTDQTLLNARSAPSF